MEDEDEDEGAGQSLRHSCFRLAGLRGLPGCGLFVCLFIATVIIGQARVLLCL